MTALHNRARTTSAGPEDLWFSWQDRKGYIRPLVKKAAMGIVNETLEREGWSLTFGQSFCIGGADKI